MHLVVNGAFGVDVTGGNAGEEFDSLVDGVGRVDVEFASVDRVNDGAAEVEVFHVAGWQHDALGAGDAFFPANPIITLDFMVHPAHRLDFTVLVDRSGDGDFLADGDVSDGG